MIEIKNLSAGYGNTDVLHKLSLSFKKGELTTVIGPNGSGKSTILKTMLGILPHTGGDLFIDGVNLNTIKRGDIAKRIAYLAQGNHTPDMTVRELVLHGRFPYLKYPSGYSKKDKEIAHAAILDMGIEKLSESPLSTLSGGMKQSAYIAMALAQETDYILFDEPTTYLDVSHQLELMKMLRSLADMGKGVALVMHDLPMALAFSDSISVLKDGEILFFGAPEELLTTDIIKKVFGVSISSQNGEYYYQLSSDISKK